MTKELLNLKSDGNTLGISRKAWQDALARAVSDPVVQIRHAEISGDAQSRIHVAAIPSKVGCHFHAAGDEDYVVVSGKGTLYWGKVEQQDDGQYKVLQETPVPVTTGDRFVVPEGYAHQLAKSSDSADDLVILFRCPDSHLNDTEDRVILPQLAP